MSMGRNTLVTPVCDDGAVFLMRVALPDRPGSLGAVATAIGTLGADISAVSIVQRGEGSAVDDFIVDLPPGRFPDGLVSACHSIDGVRVEWISRYPEGAGLETDLEALERMLADPDNAAETLTSAAPGVFHTHWALLIERGSEPRITFSTTLAPDLSAAELAALAPLDEPRRVQVSPTFVAKWGETVIALAPVRNARTVVVGRQGGPAFLDSELARLKHLAGLVP